MKRIAAMILCALLPCTATAQSYDDVVTAELLPGWRLANGDHMAALRLSLAPGWKTYWRTPGDAGIPPQFDWRGASNTKVVQVQWPAPVVFWQSGMRSVGYKGEVVLPLRVTLKNSTKDARLGGTIEIGICKDVCLPHSIRVTAQLAADQKKPDSVIAAAMADTPFGAKDAGVSNVSCQLSPRDEGMGLRVSIDMPRGTGREETVIEAADPNLWIADPETSWSGGKLIAETRVMHMSGGAFALDRSSLRIVILGGHMPVELAGCTG
jgi:DsbC/DsbD-like thiol-disulfide interchange protein